MKAKRYGIDGTEKGSVELPKELFEAEVNEHLIWEAVKMYLGNQRQGTAAAKNRAKVSGGGRKPWRQKGTGRARAGTIRAAQFTGGGVVFPPSPRDFSVKVNKKAARAALRAALSDHVQAGTFALLSATAFDAPSTKSAADLISKWGGEAPAVVVVNDDEETLGKSFRNLDRVIVTTPSELEVAEVVWARSLLVSEASLEALQRRAS